MEEKDYDAPEQPERRRVSSALADEAEKEVAIGERSRNSKFSYVSPRSIYGETSNEGKESASTYPCRSLSGSVQVNGVDGVVLVVIQITDDQVPNGQHLRVQHTYGADDVSSFLIQQGERRG